MAESRLRRAAALALAAFISAACVVGLNASQTQSHSTHTGSIELYRGTSGPYELLVAVVPFVGYLEVTVVFAPDTPEAVLPYTPRVVVLASRRGERLEPVSAMRSPTLANEYAAVLQPQKTGEWEITINIDGDPGSTSLTLPVTITGRAGFPWPALLAGLGVLLPILWLVFAPRKKRARSRPRGRGAQ